MAETAEILLKIKADNSDASRALKETKGDLAGLDNAGLLAGGGMASLAAGATAVAASVAAVGAVALTAATAIFNLTKNAAEYGSAIYDASQKTGLGAQSLSALKFAAEQSGSSFEQVTKGITVFGIMLGEAAQGSEKAQDNLKSLGVTSGDLETALGQVFKTISEGKTDTDRLALATAAFGKKIGPDLIPLIKDADGNFGDLIDKAQKLGVTMTDEAAAAADEFGDTLDTLTLQAAGVGRQFATELMPMMVQAMNAISNVLVENQGVAARWGQILVDAVNGSIINIQKMGPIVNAVMQSIGYNFLLAGTRAEEWAERTAWAAARASFALLNFAMSAIEAGEADRKANKPYTGVHSPQGMAKRDAWDARQAAMNRPLPRISGGGGGGGGGSSPKGPTGPTPEQLAAEAERQRKALVNAAQDAMRDQLEIYRAGYEERQQLLASYLSRGEILEIEKIRGVARIRLEALTDEKRLAEGLLANDKINLNEEERADILQKIKVLIIQIRIEKLRGGTEINEQVKKEIADAEKQLEIEKARLEVERQRQNEKKKQAAQAAIDNDRAKQAEAARARESLGMGNSGGLSTQSLLNSPEIRDNQAAVAGIEALSAAFSGLGQALGQVVSAYVLYGNAGTSVRKVTAQILASLAQQAAVKAVFELAEGFAALAMAFFGIPNAGPSASAHFAAAAIYGSIAGIAAVAGRAVAGDAFNEQTSGGSSAGAGGDSDNGNRPGLNFTERFQGFDDRGKERDRVILAAFEKQAGATNLQYQALAKALGRWEPRSATDVLMAAVSTSEGSSAVFDASLSEIQADGGKATEWKRGMGEY